jgi:hypothetical protein
VFQIGGNTFYDGKNKIPMIFPEFKRSRIGIITEFCKVPSGFPNQGIQGNLGTARWVRLYWFCHVIGTDASKIVVAKLALLKRMFPFFIVMTALGLSFNIGRCLHSTLPCNIYADTQWPSGACVLPAECSATAF